MPRLKDLTGKCFNRLTVLKRDANTPIGSRRVKWICKCACGKVISVVSSDLISGHTGSCGCFQKSQASTFLSKIRSKNSNFHLTKTKAYRCWRAMMSRCYHPTNKYFNYYGGRGIKVTPSWHSYQQFHKDMGDPKSNQTLDRINCEGDYSKENCRWATMKEQNNNRRSNLTIYVNGIKYSAKQFSSQFNISYSVVRRLYKEGLSGEEILKIATNFNHQKYADTDNK